MMNRRSFLRFALSAIPAVPAALLCASKESVAASDLSPLPLVNEAHHQSGGVCPHGVSFFSGPKLTAEDRKIFRRLYVDQILRDV